MSYKGLPENLVARISPLNARVHAVSAGWVRLPVLNGKVAIFTHPTSDSDLDQLIIPLDAGIVDYGRRMAEVVANLADLEDRPAIEVLNDLLLPPSDVLRFRLVEQETEAGIIPLNQGIDLLLGARKALLSAACSVILPQPFHPRLSRAEAEQLVGASRMGQTERASYSVTIACPLDASGPGSQAVSPMPLFAAMSPEPPPTQGPRAQAVEPFTRQVTRLLMRSVARIAAAVDSDTVGSLTKPGGHEPSPTLSANLCDALLMMHPEGDRSRLVLSASWSRAIPRPPAEESSVVSLRSEHFPVIARLSQDLRPAREPRPTYLVGLVDVLQGDPDETGQVRGDVQLQILNQEEMIRARVTLNAGDYHLAWKAHGVGGYIALNGILIRGGRVHRIEGIRDFRFLNESAATPE